MPRHRHDVHQLSVAAGGPLALEADGRTWVVLPPRALWVPAGTDHSVDGLGLSTMTTVWLAPDRCPLDWPTTAVDLDPLAARLVDRLADHDLAADARSRTEAVLYDVVRPVPVDPIDLPRPTDDRARRVADALLATPGDGRSLASWGREVGASARTLQRSFRHDTGLGFQEWRTRARVAAALALLVEDRPVAAVAADVGFATTSAEAVEMTRPGSRRTSPRQSLGEKGTVLLGHLA